MIPLTTILSDSTGPTSIIEIMGCGASTAGQPSPQLTPQQQQVTASISAVLEELHQHPADADVQVKGCKALRAFSQQSDENDVIIAKKGGITQLLKVLQQHPTHAGVVGAACAALCSLAMAAALVANEGGITQLLKVLQQHLTHAGVVEQACWALRRLAVNAENRVTMANEGGIAQLLKVLQ